VGEAFRTTRSSQRGSLQSDADFRRAVDQLKSSVLMSGVVGRAIQLKRAGREWKGLCPFHQERTPSFTVVDAHERAYCFGCTWQGDQLAFVMKIEGCSFREAYRLLASQELPTWTPQEREKAQAEDRLERLADENAARQFFKEARPVAGTDGEVYLRARGITVDVPDDVRFGMVPAWRDKDTNQWGPTRPALVCGARDATSAVVGIQRIFFRNDKPALGKADKKLSLGSIKGAALQLGAAEETVILAEGPEDGLSIVQEGPGHPVWVPFGTGCMPAVEFPPLVRRVILAGQNNTAGRVAVEKAALAFLDRGLAVGRAWPASQYDDWNDQLRGAR